MEPRSFLYFCSTTKQVAKVAYNIIYETPHTYKPSISQQLICLNFYARSEPP